MSHKNSNINIFEYENYRSFLKEWVSRRKAEGGPFSFRFFSKAAGFTSPNFLKLVIEGQRNLSPESVEKFVHALKLRRDEAEFFRNLVHLNQAKTVAEKNHFAEQLLKCRPYRELHPLKGAQFAYYANWYLIPVRELIDTEGFREDPEWIARQLVPAITPAEASKALDTLLELGMAERGADGKLVQKNALISTDDEVSSASVGRFHREMMARAAEAIDRFPREEREISAVTMSLSEEGLRQAKALVQKFRKDLMELAGRDRHQTAVYEFNFQLFPLTRPQKEGDKS